MTITNTIFICFSDLHATEKNNNIVSEKLQKLQERAITLKQKYNRDDVVFLVPGDIAFSGKEKEYSLVSDLFKKLSSIGHVIVTAGNHDFDFHESDDEMRKALIDLCVTKGYQDERVRTITKGMTSFDRFKAEITGKNNPVTGMLTEEYQLSQDLTVVGLNTAWCSFIDEKSGQLYFPQEQVKVKKDSELKVAIFHHPLTWFNADNSKKLREELLSKFDIVVTGHEHESEGLKISRHKDSTLFVENLPFHDEDVIENGFSYFIFDDKNVIVKKSIWNGSSYIQGSIVKEDLKPEITSNLITARSSFLKEIDDVGANIIHPDQEEIRLSDIFVYPNLSPVSNRPTTLDRISSKNILSKISNDPVRMIIIGEESSGKTTLLNKFYIDLAKSEAWPLLLNMSNSPKLKKFNTEKLRKLISHQYGIESLEEFIENPAKKVLLIDNFDQVQTNSKHFDIFYEMADKLFDSIIICASDSFKLDQSSLNPLPHLASFDKYEILRFGYKLRYELIEKWNGLNEELGYDRASLSNANHNANELFEKVLAKGVIPSLPLFLIMMLQSGDNQKIGDANTTTYGYYYQYLITSAMGQSGILKDDLDAYFQYLSELAYHFYSNSSRSIDIDDYNKFNESIKNKYGIDFNSETRLRKLTQSNIVSATTHTVSFKYHYIYFFFIAKYISNNINTCESDISGLIDNIHIKRNMNILMFLTHHSKDKRILDGIISKSKSNLDNFKPADLDGGVQFVAEMMLSEPILEYKEELKDPDRYRKIKAQQKDESYDERKDDMEEEEDFPDFIKQILSAFKSSELLSQLAKNYYGSLERVRKEELITEAIEAPLRSLEALVGFFRSDPEKLIEHVKSNIIKQDRNGALSDSEAEDLSREAIFNLILTLCYTTVAKVSFSIADKSISRIVKEVCAGNESHAYSLISFVSKMETGKDVDTDELKRLCVKLNKNSLAMTILRGFVLRYLYMFEIRDAHIKSICGIAKINYSHVSRKIGMEKINHR